MEFRHSGQSNQRRRRVLKDESLAASGEPGEAAPRRRGRSGAGAGRPYTEAALAEHQARVTDLIPKRPWTLLVVALVLLVAVAAVQALYAHREIGARLVGSENVTALDPNQRGSLAGWLSSALLGLAAVAAISVYSIRRHRIDDYKGKYRVWLPFAVLCLLASIDATTGLHRFVRGAWHVVTTTYAKETTFANASTTWWVLLATAAVVFIALRIGMEMRRSAGSAVWVTLAAGGYLVMAAIELGYLWNGLGLVTTLAASSAKLTADLALLMAVATYARYVFLDAQGILAQRRREREARRKQRLAEKAAKRQAKLEAKEAAKAAKEAAREESRQAKIAAKQKKASDKSDEDAAVDDHDESTSDKSRRAADDDAGEDDASHKNAGEKRESDRKLEPAKPAAGSPTRTPAPTDSKPSAKPATTAKPAPPPPDSDDELDDEDEDGDDSQMSRAERRRLKKLARRDVRRAA